MPTAPSMMDFIRSARSKVTTMLSNEPVMVLSWAGILSWVMGYGFWVMVHDSWFMSSASSG